MKVRFLGTAAGGGAPQWNCGCAVCDRARTAGVSRTQDCLAVSGDGSAWYLVNASPDLRTQLLASPELRPPPGTRDTPIRGVLFTSAELDHTLGLLSLRETGGIDVYATAWVHHALKHAFPVEAALAGYTEVREHRVRGGEPFELAGGLRVVPTVLSDKRPRYAKRMKPGEWVCAYRFESAAGVFVYAPGLSRWSAEFGKAIAGADVVALDGTFLTEDEMGPARPASGMGHLAIRDVLPLLAAEPGPRYLFTHLNNTNPLVLPGAPELAELAAVNAAVAADGHLLEL
ncbi:pyrroloquinoline quinone biosynthesis protein B [Amycolatopsis bartoniae]|uniref:Coenzyme PQQ synthesis protein B n=1 Tax=Amycolatopsis bartoniae TaxID=941986 RepID=A0A8H9IPG8_9PSEU|nr:MBL fold metallo-hydrolase [Amycolatopsis bartoniae]MBB2937959.1 pyrroloquinoline quinone biosynthesis protein B [Amycolatopsis bartoniae]TVT08553.1 pyrroloquinoline quinone biosynthesis protein PqqB [Amycolatopsis bartoniae]GHF41970.1 coenzyme PQQ synthesis protein B [Amycolatopsis bartoniae]